MTGAVVVAAVVTLVAVVFAALADRGRRRAHDETARAEARMHAAQAEYGALTVRIEELEAAAVARQAPRPASEHADDDETSAGAAVDEIADPETGLPGERFFDVTLTSRVAAAKRHLRPVAVVLLEVADTAGAPVDATPVAAELTATLREADIACRLPGEACFGMLLEDTSENGAVWTVERFRRATSVRSGTRILRAGIACYPAHAFDADELLARASEALEAARQWRQDRIEVATASEA